MKKFKLLFIVIILLKTSAIVLADISPAVILTQGKAIFRIENQIYFFQDIGETLSNLKKLSCLRKSAVLSALKLSKKELPLKTIDQKYRKTTLGKVLTYYKLQTLVLKKSAIFNQKELVRSGLSRCFGENINKWTDEEKVLVRAEFFLREKFDGKLNQKDLSVYLNSVNKSIKHLQFF